jgi:diketogulonate reductase-like aldo/keto reductase
VQVFHHPFIIALSRQMDATVAQIIFSFARSIGILPLTGTSSAEHMKQDLGSFDLEFSVESLRKIDGLVG